MEDREFQNLRVSVFEFSSALGAEFNHFSVSAFQDFSFSVFQLRIRQFRAIRGLDDAE